MHVVNVAMEILIAAPQSGEFDLPLAIQVALLHDTDRRYRYKRLKKLNNTSVAPDCCWCNAALTKNASLPEDEQISDSVQRIKFQSKEIWAVKLADRITNLMPPPHNWSRKRIAHYLHDSKMILDQLKEGNVYLANPAIAKNKRIHPILIRNKII